MSRRRRGLAAAPLVVAASLTLAACGGGSEETVVDPAPPATRASSSAAAPEAPPLPAAPESALVVPQPRPLQAGASRWATVLRSTVARALPRADSAAVGELSTQTEEGTTNIVLVVGRVQDADGRLWIRARLPVLPNNTVGWVPREALGGYGEVDTHLVVDRTRLTATLFRTGRKIFEAPVGIGEDRWPTPVGRFYIRNRLTSYDSPMYGPLAFGTSARSAVLTDWPAGGFVGIHGTDQPEILPGRVSHGCIRLRNDDILRLDELMPVGTPLTVRA